MTKEDFLIINGILSRFNFDELDQVELFMWYEQEAHTKIPDEWFAEAQLQKPEKTTDWSSFRREAAKDLLAAIMVQNGQDFFTVSYHPHVVSAAIKLADELIKQLKEK